MEIQWGKSNRGYLKYCYTNFENHFFHSEYFKPLKHKFWKPKGIPVEKKKA